MATGEAVSGFALASVLAGTILVYSGIKGISVFQALQSVIQGKSPQSVAQTQPISALSVGETDTSSQFGGGSFSGGSPGTGSGDIGGNTFSGGSAEQILQKTAAQFGWTGSQWTCLRNVEMAEAGFNPHAKNPASGALGLAQALGHGGSNTAGSLGNEYGGYGLSAAQAKAANSGDAGAQALWMCNYIKSTYGSPCAAWAHEQSHHWY